MGALPDQAALEFRQRTDRETYVGRSRAGICLTRHDAVEFARSGDTLIVWKLDHLARSMKQLIETIENLRGVASVFAA